VARAGLSDWASTRARFAVVAQTYARYLRRVDGVELMPGFGTSWVSTTAIVHFAEHHGPTDEIVNALAARGVMTRRWWCRGLHEEDAFAGFDRESLPVTVRLAASTLGLPCFIDMNRFDIAYVCSAVEEVLQQVPSVARTPVAA
jgi:dTDP-4-amino-4,6-dideoxygalactose transaminase